jgi:FKBP-type peptidyl-prolyl cis-trans isomerase (trigger factor)
MAKKTATQPEKNEDTHHHEGHTHTHADNDAPSLIAPNTVISITIPWTKAQSAYQKARSKVAQTVKIAGFRKGKVPPDVAEKMLGTAEIIEKALEHVLPEAYVEQIKAENKKPLTQPMFRGVSLEVGKDWIIEAEIAERPEVKVGEYKKIVKEARHHVDEELKKREVEKSSKTPATQPAPELTEAQKRDFTLQHIYQHLIEAIKPRIPELLVRREVEYDLEQLSNQLKSINMTFEQYLERRAISQDMLTQQMALSALGRLQLLFIVDTIAQENKLEVTEAEVEKYITEKVEENMRKQYSASPEYRRLLGQTILRQNVAEHLLAL